MFSYIACTVRANFAIPFPFKNLDLLFQVIFYGFYHGFHHHEQPPFFPSTLSKSKKTSIFFENYPDPSLFQSHRINVTGMTFTYVNGSFFGVDGLYGR